MSEQPKLGWRPWGEALAAVLLGNVCYFGLMVYLPRSLQHEPFGIDPGLAADFVVCSAIYLLIRSFRAR